MKPAVMRFNGFQWSHNPRKLEFIYERRTKENALTNGKSEVRIINSGSIVVKGEGELYGADCLDRFKCLFSVFKKGECGILAIDGAEPMYAVFESLTVTGEPKPNLLGYRFVFRELPEKKRSEPPEQYIAREGEDLWDVAYRFGKDINYLTELNPWIRRPDISLSGRAVALC